MTTVHEIAAGCETVTTVIDLTNPYNEERLVGPLIVGHYCDDDVPVTRREVWVEQEGKRVGFIVGDLPAIIKQLKRVERLMKEQA